MLYSLYQKVNGEWVGNHRFSLESAIGAARHLGRLRAKVAVVPDNVDPAPYLRLVDQLA
jgi:hypothetical protein